MYKSLTAQTLHYFSRPHEAVRRAPITGPAAWRGGDLAASTAWRHRLGDGDVAELDRALAAAKTTGRPFHGLRAADLPLPGLAAKLAAWRHEVAAGRGFVLIQGFPVDRWGADDAAITTTRRASGTCCGSGCRSMRRVACATASRAAAVPQPWSPSSSSGGSRARSAGDRPDGPHRLPV